MVKYSKNVGEFKMKDKILIWGASGFKNMGDEAMLSANLYVLRKELKNRYELIVLSSLPEVTSSIHKVESKPDFNKLMENKVKRYNVSYYSLFIYLALFLRLLINIPRIKRGKNLVFLNDLEKDFLTTLYNSKAVLLVGGGYLNDIWLLGGLISRGILIILADKLKIPIFLGAQTIGPANTWFSRIFLKYILNRVNLITLREEYSFAFLKRLSISDSIMKVVPDDAFDVESISEENAMELLKKEGIDVNQIREKGYKIVAINPRAWWKTDKDYIDLEFSIKKCIETFLKNNYFIVLFPTSFSNTPIANDVKSSIELLQNFEREARIAVLKNEYTWKELKGILKLVDCAVGVSYHFCVFSFSNGVPVIGLYIDDYYKFKLKGLFKLIGIEELAINVKERDLLNILEDFIENVEILKPRIINCRDRIINQTCYAVKQLVKFLTEEGTI